MQVKPTPPKSSSTYKLLNVDSNPKTVKNHAYGYLTGVLYLAPADLASTPELPINVCTMAHIAGCKDPCLNLAGRGKFNATQAARIRKTVWFATDRQGFMEQLAKDIEILARRAAKRGLKPLVRLNGTSDIKWENIRFEYEFVNNKTREVTLFQLFPEVQFYDYTKMPSRADNPEFPKNYDLTFSYSGVPEYQKYVNRAVFKGMRVAVVFDKKETVRSMVDNEAEFLGLPMVDGDDDDVRHLDPQGSVVALYAKGPAKADVSGFVVRS